MLLSCSGQVSKILLGRQGATWTLVTLGHRQREKYRRKISTHAWFIGNFEIRIAGKLDGIDPILLGLGD